MALLCLYVAVEDELFPRKAIQLEQGQLVDALNTGAFSRLLIEKLFSRILELIMRMPSELEAIGTVFVQTGIASYRAT